MRLRERTVEFEVEGTSWESTTEERKMQMLLSLLLYTLDSQDTYTQPNTPLQGPLKAPSSILPPLLSLSPFFPSASLRIQHDFLTRTQPINPR